MIYSKSLPQEPGWYWYKDNLCELVVKVYAVGTDLYVNEKAVHACGPYGNIKQLAGFWAGPIPIPGDSDEYQRRNCKDI